MLELPTSSVNDSLNCNPLESSGYYMYHQASCSCSSSLVVRKPASIPGLLNSFYPLLTPFIFICSSTEESLLIFSSHLSLGLSTGLLPWNFPFRTFFSRPTLALSNRPIWSAHPNLSNFIYFNTGGRSNNSYRCAVYLSILSYFHPVLTVRFLVSLILVLYANYFPVRH